MDTNLTADDVEVVDVFLQLAAGEVTEEELAAWIDRNSRKRES
jgi:prophage maintenance system killer protein